LVHQLITISEEITSDKSTWDQIDQKLENALHAVQIAATIKLRPEMGRGIELIRWLSKWSVRYHEKNRSLLCISDDPAQYQSLELSHPDNHLICISSLNDVPKILNSLSQAKNKSGLPQESNEATPQPEKTIEDHETRIIPATTNEKQIQNNQSFELNQMPDHTQRNISITPSASENQLSLASKSEKAGTETRATQAKNNISSAQISTTKVIKSGVVEISGEYRCDNCGMIRMFCKGDIVTGCENRECTFGQGSFTLLFDLF
jgi:hypothetical protein